MLLEGLHIPLTTPFHPDGRLNLPKLAANVARSSKSPAAGLIVLGPSGESTLLTDDEGRDVLRAAAQAAAPENVLLVGHEPYLSRLISLLVSGGMDVAAIEMKKGGLCKLEVAALRHGQCARLAWLLPPSQMELIA